MKADKIQNATLVQNVDAEQLIALVLNALKPEFEELKKNYEPKSPSQLMTRKEVAAFLRTDESTIRVWEKAGKLKSYAIGGKILLKREEVEQALISFR